MFLPDAIRMERFYTELAARAAATQVLLYYTQHSDVAVQ